MSKLGARPLTEREWAMLEHMVDTGGWTPDDSQPFDDTDECRAIVLALGDLGLCLLDGGRGVHPETWGALIAPEGIAYHRDEIHRRGEDCKRVDCGQCVVRRIRTFVGDE